GGRFALRENGAWRTFRPDTTQLRRFLVQRIAPAERYGNQGAWGTRILTWDNSFQSATHFVKDDSTMWADVSDHPILPVQGDSLRVFSGGADSLNLWMYDPDWNHSNPIA